MYLQLQQSAPEFHIKEGQIALRHPGKVAVYALPAVPIATRWAASSRALLCSGDISFREPFGRKQVRCLVLNRFASHQSDIAVFGNSDIGNAPSPNAPKHNFGIGLARFVKTGSAQLDLCFATTLAKIEDVNRCYRFEFFSFLFEEILLGTICQYPIGDG